jgi:hypothetical protein
MGTKRSKIKYITFHLLKPVRIMKLGLPVAAHQQD